MLSSNKTLTVVGIVLRMALTGFTADGVGPTESIVYVDVAEPVPALLAASVTDEPFIVAVTVWALLQLAPDKEKVAIMPDTLVTATAGNVVHVPEMIKSEDVTDIAFSV